MPDSPPIAATSEGRRDLKKTSQATPERAFRAILVLALLLPLTVLGVLMIDVFTDGSSRLTGDFLNNFPSELFPELAGIFPALWGSFYLLGLTVVLAIPLGVGAAVYLEEYAPRNWMTNIIEINVSNLAGVPSIIYGLLGLQLFVYFLGMGRSLLAGACTLTLLVLPVVVTAAREALRTVPRTLREASWALGADRWETIRRVVLPMSLPGILTGVILSMARAVGETAPLILIAQAFISFAPRNVSDPFTVLPLQIYDWVSRPEKAFHVNAAAGIIVLLALMLILNSLAIFIRYRLQRRIYW